MRPEIEIELCGYKGKITHIRAKEASPPEYPKDIFYVYVSFDEPYPENIVSTAFTIPAQEYSRVELLAMVKKEGERQLAEAIAKHIKEREANALRQQRGEELTALAKRMEEVLGSW